MPVEYKFYESEWMVEVRYFGPVTVADMRDSLQRMVDERLFSKPLRLLGNITGVEPNFSYMDMVRHQEWRRQFPQYSKMALVASTTFEFGVARQFIMATNSAGGAEMEVFHDLQEARNWLGLR